MYYNIVTTVQDGQCMFNLRDIYAFNQTRPKPEGGTLKMPSVPRTFARSLPKVFSAYIHRYNLQMYKNKPQIFPKKIESLP